MASRINSSCKYLGLVLLLAIGANGIHSGDSWQPFQQEYYQESKPYQQERTLGFLSEFSQQQGKDKCEVYKVGFTQDLYFQYIQYKSQIPDLKEFTLCFWSKFYNHSNDHPIFSYAVDGQPRAISSWVSNTNRSSYFSLAVEGHTFYRLNYPLRLNRWYHTCQSWNGKTGEWQIWVNAERVGRGFHNRLVGNVILSGGVAITGQEQNQLGGGFQEGEYAPKGSGGILGEVTMVQFYKVALTAGKAHKDHKHHHAHQYDHNGMMITTPAPTTPNNRPTLPPHPLLTGGQINRMVRINFANGQQQQPQLVQGQNFDAQYLNGQFVGNLLTQQLSQGPNGGPQKFQGDATQGIFSEQQRLQTQPSSSDSFSTQFLSVGNTPLLNTGLNHASNNPVRFIDNSQSFLETHDLFKRTNKDEAVAALRFGDRLVSKRETEKDKSATKRELTNGKDKRQVYVGGGNVFGDGFIGGDSAGSNEFDESLLYGLAGVGQNQLVSQKQKQTEDEREPAEAEVKAVLNICSGCDPEPFDKALVFGWRTVPKKLFSGAYYAPAVPECKVF